MSKSGNLSTRDDYPDRSSNSPWRWHRIPVDRFLDVTICFSSPLMSQPDWTNETAKVIEQIRMAGPIALGAKVFRCLHDADPEQLLPEPVDRHPRGQTGAPRRRTIRPNPCAIGPRRSSSSGAGRPACRARPAPRIVVRAANQDVGGPPLGLLFHDHRRGDRSLELSPDPPDTPLAARTLGTFASILPALRPSTMPNSRSSHKNTVGWAAGQVQVYGLNDIAGKHSARLGPKRHSPTTLPAMKYPATATRSPRTLAPLGQQEQKTCGYWEIFPACRQEAASR